MATATAEAEMRQRLLRTVKKEVKQIMEEAVTRKFVHEDSSHIISFCAAVEACVLHGLKRRAAGFLRSNKIAALFMKVAKTFPLAEELCRKVQELEQLIDSRRSQGAAPQEHVRKSQKVPHLSAQAVKHLWIRTALFEKVLDKIVQHLVENSSKYYEKEALMMDPVDGPILGSLLVGPCALEYTKMKTADHFWTDPSADELVQRHRIHSAHCRQDSPTKRPALCIQKRHSSGSMDDRLTLSARDYVESLHQNSRATLLYGKNNVLVQPKDDMEPILGYLSLHQTGDTMTLKWTPNQLMNGSVGDLDYERSIYWDYAMTIRLEEIVYLHCHQQIDSGGTVVLVSQDGIQRPPLRFPKGGHLLAFLSCLENGLLPRGQLDPPLWSQRGKGKVFPKLRKRSPPGSAESSSDKEEEEATDYVFRLIFPGTNSEFVPQDLMDVQGGGIPLMWQPNARKSSCSSCSQSGSSDGGPSNGCNHERAPLKMLCDNMKYQILSRAFYGWLAYCRHLSTVRTHLSALVNHTIICPATLANADCGLTKKIWQTYLEDKTSYEEQELLRLIYYGGIEMEIRKEVWPFLLGHYQFGMTEVERKEVDDKIRTSYEQTMGEWMACEAVVRQRERESHAAALAKCSSAVSLDTQMQRMLHRDSTVSNESSQSCGSDSQNHLRLQSDSSTSTQVFESVEEAEGEQLEKEVGTDSDKRAAPIPNGTVPNGTCSPDSGHPSSRNFSTASGYSEHSFSTEEVIQCSQHTMAQRWGGGVYRAEEEFPPQQELQDKVPSLEGLLEVLPLDERSKETLLIADGPEQVVPVNVQSEGAISVTEGSDKLAHVTDGSEKIVPVMDGSEKVIPVTDGSEKIVPVSDGSEKIVPVSDGSEKVVPVTDGSEKVIPVVDGSEKVIPVTDGSKKVVPVADRSEKAVPVAVGSEKLVPMMEGSEEVALVAEGSEEVAPVADGSEEVILVAEGSEEVVSVANETELIPLPRKSEEIVAVVDGSDPDGDASKAHVPLFQTEENMTQQELVGQQALPEGLEMEGFCQQLATTENNVHASSPASSTGVIYAQELLDMYTVNLHRIEKDVQRCDRNYWYFTPTNLEKLRNVMCSYIWQHLEIGYVQGMCDLLAPLLVVLDDEAIAFSCFTQLMKRMNQNFPHGGAMDTHFANMRSLIQILDSELFELMHQNGDYTHFYFCYRWFLLDFKRELVYGDVFSVWETIWAAKYTSSAHFVLFIALALVELYRDIILENNMDFTDIIKFFNEMAEHHDAKQVLKLARDLVYKVQTLIENK
ncbi:small G protein signaling modulator 1-like isoform X1 [Chiloscyllium plagiosum]|uniref:small G protein signaling modulator 1-like isoform X1 n=1 Tax=Chiloscyllium plagiosum TaxID=36176 RepID=UPI001CB80839|nr:small G protein signaling modulator 1-like isoform X1 [Chiloscyllium plagiosum]